MYWEETRVQSEVALFARNYRLRKGGVVVSQRKRGLVAWSDPRELGTETTDCDAML